MNMYLDPGQYGLEFFGDIEWDEGGHGFDITCVWTSKNGVIYWASDSGCCCQTPFEHLDIHDTTFGPRGILLKSIIGKKREKEGEYGRDRTGGRYVAPDGYVKLAERIARELPYDSRAEMRNRVMYERYGTLKTESDALGQQDTVTMYPRNSDGLRAVARDFVDAAEAAEETGFPVAMTMAMSVCHQNIYVHRGHMVIDVLNNDTVTCNDCQSMVVDPRVDLQHHVGHNITMHKHSEET